MVKKITYKRNFSFSAAFHVALILEKNHSGIEPSGRRLTNCLYTKRIFLVKKKFGFW